VTVVIVVIVVIVVTANATAYRTTGDVLNTSCCTITGERWRMGDSEKWEGGSGKGEGEGGNIPR
jgi:hypothetical protein